MSGRQYSEIQREQAAEGARMMRNEGVDPIVYRKEPKRTFSPNKAKNPTTVKPRGHEAFLKQIETSGGQITLEKMSSGEKVTGRVKCSDKYTVTIKQALPDGIFRDRVIFKHDISEFSAEPVPGDEVTSEEKE